MTINELIKAYYEKNPDGHYFDKDTLHFFGERISDMYVLKNTAKIKDVSGEEHECYIVSRLQRNYPGGARRTYAYFDVDTLNDIIPEEDKTMKKEAKQISIDNGNSYVTPAEAIDAMAWDVIAHMMDDDIRETVHNELAPCTEEEFLVAYLEMATDDLIIG